MSVQVSADIKKDLTPALSQLIRNTVKENLKATIADTFRSTFESTIVPAYEAGSREMFSQLQQTYSAGVEVMKADNKRICEENKTETVALRNEITTLRNVVAMLESKISNISQGGLAASPGKSEVYESDFKQLYHDGRIGESLEVALESKVTGNVLWVLKQQAQSPGGLHTLMEKSTDLCILCTAQQLSADLADQEPEEGIRSRLECLKEFIMYLIDDHLPEADVSDIVSSTLANLKSAEAKHTLVGAARTDMKMLCSILSSNF